MITTGLKPYWKEANEKAERNRQMKKKVELNVWVLRKGAGLFSNRYYFSEDDAKRNAFKGDEIIKLNGEYELNEPEPKVEFVRSDLAAAYRDFINDQEWSYKNAHTFLEYLEQRFFGRPSDG